MMNGVPSLNGAQDASLYHLPRRKITLGSDSLPKGHALYFSGPYGDCDWIDQLESRRRGDVMKSLSKRDSSEVGQQCAPTGQPRRHRSRLESIHNGGILF